MPLLSGNGVPVLQIRELPLFYGQFRRAFLPRIYSHPASRPVSIPQPNPDSIGNATLSADAVSATIRRASLNSPVEFVQRLEKDGTVGKPVEPSADFLRLCLEQLDLFRTVVDRNAVLSVYVRPPGSYVMDQLELRRVLFCPGFGLDAASECLVLIANFGVPAGLRSAEAALSNRQVDLLPEYGAVVFPMVKHPFVVGFLVAEIPQIALEAATGAPDIEDHFSLSTAKNKPLSSTWASDKKTWELKTSFEDDLSVNNAFTAEQRSRAVLISRSLATAYVMDQRALLLQQSSWQNNVRMNRLVEQIRAPLSSIRTLANMLSVHSKRTEISYDIIEDILVQGEQMKETLQKLQDAVYFTKANILRYNDETSKKLHEPAQGHTDQIRSLLSDSHSSEKLENTLQKMDSILPLGPLNKDMQMPMPPLALAPRIKNIRPCIVSDILKDLVGAAKPLAQKQQRLMEYNEYALPTHASIEEFALRQALSNLIEGALLRTRSGGKVEILATGAPAGGSLILIEDDGPDMQYMTQMHSLAPYGAELFSNSMIEDNMTWNFVAGLTVSREILESYGCVVRVMSPRTPDAAVGAGGTRIELWLPSAESDKNESFLEA